jgi:hypothetical protein
MMARATGQPESQIGLKEDGIDPRFVGRKTFLDPKPSTYGLGSLRPRQNSQWDQQARDTAQGFLEHSPQVSDW